MIIRKNSPRVFAIIPVFNRLNFTKKCLASFTAQNYRNLEVIIINDGSTDGTAEYLKKYYPEVHVIQGDGNWWWTKSMAEGVKYCLGKCKADDYILEMNNDCYFRPDYISQLIKTGKKYPQAIIGSLCVRAQEPTKVVEAGIRIDWPTGLVYGVAQTVSQKLSYYSKMKFIDKLDALPGKGTLIPLKVIKKIGNFNYRRFPHYIADYEFANRAKRAGYDLIVDPKALVKHYWEATGWKSVSSEHVNYRKAFKLLFGRKSMSNIVDWLHFINSACPQEYKTRNYYYTFLKIIKSIFSITPFYQIKPYVRLMYFALLNIYWSFRLFIYRTYLKIIQFPHKPIFYITMLKFKQLPQNPRILKLKKYLLSK